MSRIAPANVPKAALQFRRHPRSSAPSLGEQMSGHSERLAEDDFAHSWSSGQGAFYSPDVGAPDLAGFAFLQGDPYPELDMVTRSVPPEALSTFEHASSSLDPLWSQACGSKGTGCDYGGEVFKHSSDGAVGHDFSDDAVLPARSAGDHAPTSVTLRKCSSAAEAMNSIHEFLSKELRSSITKVRPQKYSIKAHVFWEAAGALTSCTLKARAFVIGEADQQEPQVLIECVRYGGDPFAFDAVFEALREKLDQDGGSSHPAAAEREVLTAPVIDHDGAAGLVGPSTGLQPLIDMLADSASPQLQAESLAALVTLANASAAEAVVVCAAVAGAQGVLAGLLASAASLNVEIAYSAARLLQCLARLAGTSECRAVVDPLVSAALPAVAAEGTDRLVRNELAQAVHGAALHCSTGRAGGAALHSASKLRRGLAEVLNEPACVEVQAPLLDALFALDQLSARGQLHAQFLPTVGSLCS